MAEPQTTGLRVPRIVTLPMMSTELEDIADRHNTYAACAFLDGDGELHDFHECRAAELRRIVEGSGCDVQPQPVRPTSFSFAMPLGARLDASSVTLELTDFEVQVLHSWHQARADFFAERDDEAMESIHGTRALELANVRQVSPRLPAWRRWIPREGLFGWMRR